MKLKKLPCVLSVCKLKDTEGIDFLDEFVFVGKTDEEISLVCREEKVPENTTARDDGWKGFRIEGILSKLSGILADNKIGIFAVSTFNTDYILVKEENFERALHVLAQAGYEIIG